jgi:hypothetical protein
MSSSNSEHALKALDHDSRPTGREPPVTARSRGAQVVLIFAAGSLIAVLAGCLVAFLCRVSPEVWGRNAAAWGIGGILAACLARAPRAGSFRFVLILAPVALAASLLGSGQSGVHRWVAVGPLRWNVAFVCLPPAIVAFAALVRSKRRWIWVAVALSEALLCLQPDTSQATAFAAAINATVFISPARVRTRIPASLAFLVMACLSAVRPDPLAPVPEVECIFGLAQSVSSATTLVCAAALAATCVAPLAARKTALPGLDAAAGSLSAYFLICSLMPVFGAFPVPLVGMGMSPIIGFWLGMGALWACILQCRQLPVPDQRSAGDC